MPQIEFIAETASTNADLLARLRHEEAVPEGAWLVADRQTGGRGRQGRIWLDGNGNFMGSVVVVRRANDPPPATLSFVAGLAVHEAVAALLANPMGLMLKWPNDLLWNGAKLAGILLEQDAGAIVAGIGVNLASAPDVAGRATMALAELGPAPNRDHFARLLASSFATELAHWRNHGLAGTLARWRAAAHPEGTMLHVHQPGHAPLSGEFSGLGEDGALHLRLADGSICAIHAGDIFV